MLPSSSPPPVPAASIDLVLPCYNPPTGWVRTIADSTARLRARLPHITWRVIVVNDGARSGVSPADVAVLTEQVPRLTYLAYEQNRGKGHALRHGIRAATAPITIFTDIDFPYTEDSLVGVATTLLGGGADVVTGARDESYYSAAPPSRQLISKLLRHATRTLLGLAVSDTQAGLKGFNAAGRAVFLRTTTDRYLFDLEFIFLASHKSGGAAALRVLPLPVRLRPGIVFSKMNWKILLSESRSFARILRQRWM